MLSSLSTLFLLLLLWFFPTQRSIWSTTHTQFASYDVN
jgi:hypothetical protein